MTCSDVNNKHKYIWKFVNVLTCHLQFLIGYNRGLVVLWDNKESNADQTYNATQVR